MPVVAAQSPTAKKHDPPPGHVAPGVVHVTGAASAAASVDASFCPTGAVEHATSAASVRVDEILNAAVMLRECTAVCGAGQRGVLHCGP